MLSRFTKIKLPGWMAVIWSGLCFVYAVVPDWYGRVAFWLEMAQAIGGNIGLIATGVTSPWFNLILFLVGILYLLFVDEPKSKLRQPMWPIIGWSVVVIVAFVFFLVLFAGYVAIQVDAGTSGKIERLTQANQHLQQKVEALEQQTLPWEITKGQKEKLRTALNKVPLGERYKLVVHVIPGCSKCSVYADTILGAVEGLPGWEVRGDTYFGLESGLTGVRVGSDPETPCPPTVVQLIRGALDDASIPHSSLGGKDKGLAPAPGFCVVLVGDKP